MIELIGCGSNSCKLVKPKGMATNGPCMCLIALPQKDRINVEKKLWSLEQRIEALTTENERLVNSLQRASAALLENQQ